MSELSDFQKEIGEWGEKTFNKKRNQDFLKSHSSIGIVNHLKKEVKELALKLQEIFEENSMDPPVYIYEITFKEAADCFLLLLHYAHLHGFDLLEEVRKKMKINRRRKWGKPDKNGVIEHIK